MKNTHRGWGTALCVAWYFVAQAPAYAADQTLPQRGAYLAKIGDCVACHTAVRGQPFAGGLPMTTPLGQIYTTNITPDRRTGIGNYTEADFAKALRQGIAKDGRNLYPAMPYPSYAKVNDEDTKALYAYFMNGVTAVQKANRESDIPWPLNMRWPLKFWNFVFLEKNPYQNKSDEDVAWNRGAYLIQGLGHCGSCHTSRGVAFQEEAVDERGKSFLTGALLDGWFAANLTGERNVGLGRWNDQDLQMFLKTGANRHATVFGSMTSVINHSTQALSNTDIAAMSTYLKSLQPRGGSGTGPYAYSPQATKISLMRPANDAGAAVYTAYCIHCHRSDGQGFSPLLAPLAGNPVVLDRNATSIINLTLNGSDELVINGVAAPYPMPKYGIMLSDRQIADVLTFVRAGWNNRAPTVTPEEVMKVRKITQLQK